MPKTFKPGDVVIDRHCRGKHYCADGQGLPGIVGMQDGETVWGDWLYPDGWRDNMVSNIEHIELHPDPDPILASWTAWRLLDG